MAMKPYFYQTKGTMVSKPYSNTHETTSSLQTVRDHSLSGVISNKGNYRAATPQEFITQKVGHWLGNEEGYNVVVPEYYYYNRGVLTYSPANTSLSGAFSDAAFNTAIGKVYEQIRGSLDLSVDFAQARQCRDMVTKLYHAIADVGSVFRRLRRCRIRDMGSIWLEWTYGWKPLAQDIYETLDHLTKPETVWVYCRGRGSNTSRDTRSFQSPAFIGIDQINNFTLQQRCEVKVAFCLKPSVITSLAGYTSLNPVSIAWELVPYSFVVDWIIDVGGYLRNLESACIYNQAFAFGYSTQGWLISGDARVNGSTMSGNLRQIVNMQSSHRYSAKKRSPLSGIPFPRAPSVNPQLGVGRMLNAAALLSQLIPHR